MATLPTSFLLPSHSPRSWSTSNSQRDQMVLHSSQQQTVSSRPEASSAHCVYHGSATNGVEEEDWLLYVLQNLPKYFSAEADDLLQSAALCMISGAVLAGSTNIAVFLVFRFFAGAGAFMILAAVPIWMAEVVPPYLRGALVQLHAIILVLGYNFASWLGYGIYHWENGGNATWRIPFAVQCFWPFCLLLGLWWCPESRM
jgi:hypothetical protein